MTTTPDVEVVLPSRPVRAAASEITALSLLAVLVVFALGALTAELHGWVYVLELSQKAGAVVLEHIGWAFSVYIPVLLAFYAIVVGGQLVGDERMAANTRRSLGFVAQLMAASMVPALTLIAFACFKDGSRIGALFVVVPVAAVMFLLAIQLGSFIVFEVDRQIRSAKRSLSWSIERLRNLRIRSRQPLIKVVGLNLVGWTLAGSAAGMLISRDAFRALTTALFIGLIASMTILASLLLVHIYYTARDLIGRIIAGLLAVSFCLSFIASILVFFVASHWPLGIGALIILVLAVTSTFWRTPRVGRIQDWTIGGAGRRAAAKTIVADYKRSREKLRGLLQVLSRP